LNYKVLLASFYIGTAALMFAKPAAAQTPQGDAAAAQLFFERGRDATTRGDAAEACKNFEESLRLDLAVGTLFNLARCEEDLGRFASAWQHLHEGIDRLEESDSRRKPAIQAANAVEKRVPKLIIAFATGAPVGQVLRDGVALSPVSLSLALPVNPGMHAVIVKADGHYDSKFEAELKEGELRTLTVNVGEPKPPEAVKADAVPNSKLLAAQPPASSPVRTAGWIIAGVGAASLGVSAVTGALAFERSQVVKDRCDASGTCDSEGLDALGTSQKYGRVATATVIIGGVFLGAGAVLILLGKPESAQRALTGTVLRF
jgi:tetratricopeptide (TPR) repeat protein